VSDPLRRFAGMAGIVTAVLAVTLAGIALRPDAAGSPAAAGERWVTAWSGNPVAGSDIPFLDCPAGEGLADQTVRNVVFLSAGGSQVRVRLTNTFGTEAVQVGRASVAVQASDARPVPGTLRTLRFGGETEVTIAAGGRALFDVAAALADPADPSALAPAYDSGDGLHPNDAGCQAIADAVDLTALLRG